MSDMPPLPRLPGPYWTEEEIHAIHAYARDYAAQVADSLRRKLDRANEYHAAELTDLVDEREEMRAERDTLRKQFNAQKLIIEGLEHRHALMASEFGPMMQRAADIEGERKANAILTAENDQLRQKLAYTNSLFMRPPLTDYAMVDADLALYAEINRFVLKSIK